MAGLEFTEIAPETTSPADSVVAAPATTAVKAAKDSAVTAVAAKNVDERVNENVNEQETDQSLTGIFVTGFIGGLAALLMPCIFPMLPLTVSFFTKGSQTKSKAVAGQCSMDCPLLSFMWF